MARRKVAIMVVMIVVAAVLLNIIFSYVGTATEDIGAKRCVYSLLRVGVALIEYANLKNATVTPPDLQVLVDEGIIEASWLSCSQHSPRFGYFGEFDLLGPRPPMALWCRSGHTASYLGMQAKAHYALDDSLKRISYWRQARFEKHLRTVSMIGDMLTWEETRETLDRLVEIAVSGGNIYVRQFAIWILGRSRSKTLEKTFLSLLEDRDGDVRLEAAQALALLKNPAGGGELLRHLRSCDYFDRMRALQALKQLTVDDFGFNPALDSEMQDGALRAFDAWWAKTAVTIRKRSQAEDGPGPDK